jgi:hypothetical protein
MDREREKAIQQDCLGRFYGHWAWRLRSVAKAGPVAG